MAISRSFAFLLGTSSSVGDSITSGSTDSGVIKDVLGDDLSIGEAEFFLYATCTVTTGTIDIYIDKQPENSVNVQKLSPDFQISPINGTVKYPLGRQAVSRYMSARIFNNAIGANLTNVSLGYELFKGN